VLALSPPRIARVGAFAVVLAGALIGFCSAALADGYNDWPGELVPSGEIDVVPSIGGKAHPNLSAYWQLQLEIGLPAGFELSVIAAMWNHGSEWQGDGLYLQPRVALTTLFSATAGFYVPFDSLNGELGLIAGLTHTVWLQKDAWKFNWNVFGTTNLRLQSPEIYGVGVLERRINDDFGIYAELDVTYPSDGVGPTVFDTFAGVEWVLDDDALNIALMWTAAPDGDPRAIGVGFWYSRRLVVGGWMGGPKRELTNGLGR